MYHVRFTRICNRGLFPHIFAAYFAITWSAYFEKDVRVFLTCLHNGDQHNTTRTQCNYNNDQLITDTLRYCVRVCVCLCVDMTRADVSCQRHVTTDDVFITSR